MTYGIHHITAISSDPQKTYDFYTHILGLRLVKKTVNQDDTSSYHLFFGDKVGSPGLDLTFFPFQPASQGMRGNGLVTTISLAVPKASLSFWIERFIKYNVKNNNIQKKFGDSIITFFDFDGQQLELVGVTDKNSHHSLHNPNLWTTQEISEDNAIRFFYGATLSVEKKEPTATILTKYLGYSEEKSENNQTRYSNKNSDKANVIDIFEMNGWPEGRNFAGTVHHIAFRVKNEKEHIAVRDSIREFGLTTTNVIDRFYFKSVYFREPNGILFEIATDEPGFATDEEIENLGESLSLPPFLESRREQIEAGLIPISTDQNSMAERAQLNALFTHVFKKKSDETIVVFHGTGDDEYGLIPLAEDIHPKASILSFRGNIQENGMNRFFRRHGIGIYDEKSIREEVEKLEAFLQKASEIYHIDLAKVTLVGLSNGANFALAYLLLKKSNTKKAAILHGFDPIKKETSLHGKKIFISTGEQDPYAKADEFDEYVQMLKDDGAEVTDFIHEGGHELTEEEISKVKLFIKT